MNSRWNPVAGALIGALFLFSLVAGASSSSAAAAQPQTSTAATPEKSNPVMTILKEKGKASYSILASGPNTKSLTGTTSTEGEKTGSGPAWNVVHYPAIGAKLGGTWSLVLTAPAAQSFTSSERRAQSGSENLVWSDPYLTLTNGSVLSGSKGKTSWNLFSYLRYYFPFSRSTNRAMRSTSSAAREAGNGQFRLFMTPSISRGSLEFSLQSFLQYRLAGLSHAERTTLTGDGTHEDYYVYLIPNLAYSVTPKFQPYIEYSTGAIRHKTTGRWVHSRSHPEGRKNASTGESIAVGANLFPTKRLSLTPAYETTPELRLNRASFSLFASYRLL
ncbi:MAG: hypothetical protein HUU37_03195 [Bdellovibrionales bacterium]|nr:hypothetical protein [Bdellovibrionales bacterium]